MRVAILIIFSYVASITAHGAWTVVTRKEQLWSFMRENRAGQVFEPGNNFLTLMDWENGWVSDQNNYLTSAAYCQSWETFEVIFIGENHISLRTAHGKYISGHPDGKTTTTATSIASWEKWTIMLDSSEQVAVLRSYHNLYMSWDPNKQKIAADRKDIGGWEMFRGWKNGPRSIWQTTDGWTKVFSFDNRNGHTTAVVPYTQYVGLTKITESPFTTSGAIDVMAGEMFPWNFCHEIKSTVSYNWQISTLEIWRDMVSVKATLDVPPGRNLALFQVQGKMGPFHVFAREFKVIESYSLQ